MSRMPPIRLLYTGELVPYVRVGRERWTPRATRYLASKDALALHLRTAAAEAGHRAPDGGGDWGITVTVSRRTRRAYDLDNAVKAIMDAANGIVWDDDVQVARIEAAKQPAGSDHLVAEFWPITEEVTL